MADVRLRVKVRGTVQSVGFLTFYRNRRNVSDEPIAYQEDAKKRLGGIAGAFLTHRR